MSQSNGARWFLAVLFAFIRRELTALGGYRAAFLVRLLGLGLGVVQDGPAA